MARRGLAVTPPVGGVRRGEPARRLQRRAGAQATGDDPESVGSYRARRDSDHRMAGLGLGLIAVCAPVTAYSGGAGRHAGPRHSAVRAES